MTPAPEPRRYVPLHPEAARTAALKRLPFDLASLAVTGLVIICELDTPPVDPPRPTMFMKMTQYLRMSDDSLIRLDMDRGVSTFKYAHTEPLSWRRTAEDVIHEVITLIQGDEPDPGVFPWAEYAEAARLRGIDVDAAALMNIPSAVLISDELAEIFEF